MQIILPTDKRNPSFNLYHSADGQWIHVFYGLELLEVVPFEREHAAYKLLVARLYNAGLKIQTLADVFDVDSKTMRGWGRALQARDPARLARMLLGAEAGRKRTAVITDKRQAFTAMLRSVVGSWRHPASIAALCLGIDLRSWLNVHFVVALTAIWPAASGLGKAPPRRSPSPIGVERPINWLN